MALQCGTKVEIETEKPDFSDRFISFMGFTGLAGTALAILAGVVLLPLYARNQALEHRLECERIRLEASRDTVRAMDRFIEEVGENDILISRLGSSRMGLFPSNEMIVMDMGNRKGIDPSRLNISPPDLPPAPEGWLLDIGAKIDSPPMRRGLLVLAVSMVVAALMIFAAPRPEQPDAGPTASSRKQETRRTL
jgi:hypothetical protein